MKRKEMDYEKRRNKRVQYFESVRHAQTVQIDDIPLPQMSEQSGVGAAIPNAPSRIPLPTALPTIELPSGAQPTFPVPGVPPPSLLKRPLEKAPASEDKLGASLKEAPGCPPGPPPNLLTMHELDSDYEDEENTRPSKGHSKAKSQRFNDPNESERAGDKGSDAKSSDVDVPKPTSVQQRILAIAGQKYDDFMKELENVHKKKESSRSAKADQDSRSDRGASSDRDNDDDSSKKSSESENSDDSDQEEYSKSKPEVPSIAPSSVPSNENTMPPHPPAPPMLPMLKLPSGPPPPPMGMPPAMMFRPPPMRPGLNSHMPHMRGMPRGIRMPPGPPPGLPPPRLMHGHHKQHPQNPIHNTLTAAPQLTKDSTKGMTTITAKPQIRNLSADVTRFVPSALRTKRDEKKVQKPKSYIPDYRTQPEAAAKGTTKDDAYMQFMREMQGLL